MTIHNYKECPRFSDCLRGCDGTCKGCNLYNAYLAGLGEGKPKWHDLRKNPNDLPKEDCETVTLHENGNKNIIKWKHREWTNAIVIPVIAWCELPKFKE